MKKITLFLMIALFAVTGSVLAIDPNDPVDKANEKVTRSFESDYKVVSELKWFESTDHFIAVFKQEDVLVKARYDKGGKFVGSTRYYKEQHLPIFILNKLKKKYPGREIFGVTEIAEGEDMEYHIKMNDEKHWYTVKVSAAGTMGITEKYKRAAEQK
ncbi:MAG: hypothetical protein ACO1NW_02855 [Chitinophagaceae bacterium]